MCSIAQLGELYMRYVVWATERRSSMTPTSDWRHLAEHARVEMDSKMLRALVEDLNRVLGEQDALRIQRRGLIFSSAPLATAEVQVS
jgi:hypothetical protein